MTENNKIRCSWCNLSNPAYVAYHDEEWGVPVHDDRKLFELLLLETFQAGLSWECVLNKREAFRTAFGGYDFEAIAAYDGKKRQELMENKGIIRNRLKIEAAVANARAFLNLRREYGSFDRYLWGFTNGETIYETGRATSPLSDALSKDLRRRGMKFVGSTIIYAYLQAVGVVCSHEAQCWLSRPRPSKE